MLTLELDMYQACALGALVYCLGRLLVQKLPFLSKYCIPAPVAGGVVFAFAHLALYATGVLELSFDTTLQSVFMTIFFCIIASKVNVTFELTIAATIFALVVGVIIAIIGYYKIPGLYQLTRVYVSIMRGTPVVAQLYFFYYGIALYSAIVRNMTPLIAVAVVMSLNMGAFMSESIRGALLSVDEGQKEAAYSLGMTNFQLVTRIVIPQAVRVALPPLFNDIINLIKMTSLAFMLGVPDIMGAAKIEGARTFRYFEIYAAVMLVYWLIIFVLGILHKLLEKKCANMY